MRKLLFILILVITLPVSGLCSGVKTQGKVVFGGGVTAASSPPTFDATGEQDKYTTSGTSITFTHTCSGSNRLLLVAVAWQAITPGALVGITYNGDALTKITGATKTFNWAHTVVELWYLIAPDTGGAYDVVITSANTVFLQGTSSSYNGVHQTTPFGTAAVAGIDDPAGSPATVNVSSATGELVVDACNLPMVGGTVTAGANQTKRASSYEPVTTGSSLSQSEEAGAESVTMSYTYTGSEPWGIVAVPLKPI